MEDKRKYKEGAQGTYSLELQKAHPTSQFAIVT